MPPRAAVLATALVLLAALALACDAGDSRADPPAAASPSASATSEPTAMSATSTPTRTPTPTPEPTPPAPAATPRPTPRPRPTLPPDPSELPSVPYPGPALGETVPIDFGEPRITIEEFNGRLAAPEDPSMPLSLSRPLMLEVETGEAWSLAGTRGFQVRMSPHRDQAVSWTPRTLDGVSTGSTDPETVVVDLVERSVTRLLPVSAVPLVWPNADHVLVRIHEPRGRERSHDWSAGIYAIDLAERTVTYVDAGPHGVLSPDGQWLATVRQTDDSGDGNQVAVRPLGDGEERILFEMEPLRVGTSRDLTATWLGSGSSLLVAMYEDRFEARLWESTTGEIRDLLTWPEPVGRMSISPDGRLAAIATPSATSVIEIQTRTVLATVIDAVPEEWSSDSAALLLVLEYCGAGGGHQGQAAWLDLASGDVRPLAPPIVGVWAADQAADEEWVWVWVPDRPVALHEPTRELVYMPEVTDIPEFLGQSWLGQWSASGRWLQASLRGNPGHGSPCFFYADS